MAASDEIWLPIESDGEEEPVADALHLLSPFALVHNKGSVSALCVSFIGARRPFFKRSLHLPREPAVKNDIGPRRTEMALAIERN